MQHTRRSARMAFVTITALALLSACRPTGKSISDERAELDAGGVPPSPAAVDPVSMLDVGQYVTDAYLSHGGTCLATDPEHGKSRLLLTMLPEAGTFLRLMVKASRDGQVASVDLARGLTGRRTMYATIDQVGQEVVVQSWVTPTDNNPGITRLPSESPAARALLASARTALTATCKV